MRTMMTLMLGTATLLGRAQWTVQASMVISGLEAVHMTDASHVFAAGKDGVLVSTTDGGTTWAPLNSGYDDDINDILRLSPTDLLLVADEGVVIRSMDNGASWIAAPTAVATELTAVGRSGNTIVAVGEIGTIVTSNDGGMTWTVSSSGTLADLQGIVVLTASEAFVCGKDGVLKRTTDGGLSWSTVALPVVVDLNDIVFVEGSSGAALVCGDEGTMLRSMDGGLTWASVVTGTTVELNALWSADAVNVYACGAAGAVLHSADAGLTWSPMTSATISELTDIQVIGGTGFAVGAGGTIIKLGPGTTGIEAVEEGALTIYPNPSTGAVTIEWTGSRAEAPVTLELVTADGRLVDRVRWNDPSRPARIEELPHGAYVVRVTTGKGDLYLSRFVVGTAH